jgi:phosphomannomutase
MKYSSFKTSIIDGLKIDFDEGWVHLRRSNTEPIIRIYAESNTKQKANELANDFINQIKEII